MSVRRSVVGIVVAGLLWLAIGAWQVLAASRDLKTGREQILALREMSLDSDLDAVHARIEEASAAFDSARRGLGGLGAAPLRLLPVVGEDLVVLEQLAAAGTAASQAGGVLIGAVADLPGGAEGLAPADGRLPLSAIATLVEPLQQADALIGRATRHLRATEGVTVVGDIASARESLTEQVPVIAASLQRASALAEALPGFLGGSESRRYLFLAQNPAEARGTGGFIGAYSILTIDRGALSFSRFDEIQKLPAYHVSEIIAPSEDYARRYKRYGSAGFWHNINMTPDFPTAARAMLTLYEKGMGERLDGVIATDPFALEALLEGSGPVDVPGFGRVGADEVVDVVANRAHAEIADSRRRKQLLGTVAVGAFQGLLEGTGDPVEVVRALADATDAGHVLLYSANPDEQAGFVRADVAGALKDPAGDFLAVVGNAGSAAKLDYYLQRVVTFDVELQSGGRSAATATVLLRNAAPSSGVSHRVIGPNVEGLAPGEQRLNLSVYAGKGAKLGGTRGADSGVGQDTELGHPVFTGTADVPASGSQQLSWTWSRPQGWESTPDGGRYRLTVQGQPTIRPTELTVTVTLPAGTRLVASSEGVEQLPGGRVRLAGRLGRETVLDLHFEDAGDGSPSVE